MGKIIKTILNGILILILSIILVLGLSLYSFKKGGSGIWFDNYGDYQILTIKIGDALTTKTFGKLPIQEDFEAEIFHREDSKYDKLNHNEQIVYDEILSLAKNILENNYNKTSLTVSLEDFLINNYQDSLSYEEKIDLIKTTCSELDYKAIYHALHDDFSYYFWWEDDMKWSVSEPVILFDDSNYSSSYFSIEINPVSSLIEEDCMIKEEYLTLAHNAYIKAIEIANSIEGNDLTKINYFKNWILDNVAYDEDEAQNIINETENENTFLVQKFISVFDEDDNTNVVCSGYVDALQLLCDLAGIHSMYRQTGQIYLDNEIENHAWNLYKENETYYLIDLTNSESGTIGYPNNLFLKEIEKDSQYTIKISNWSSVTYIEKDS